MARIGISITKEVAFRDNQQEFSNVYFYTNGGGSAPDATGAEALLDALVTFEKQFHATVVSFVHGRVWTAGGTEAQNSMLMEKTLSGTGSAVHATRMDRERAILIQYEAGFDSRGKRVYLRKWYHTCGQWPLAASTIADATLANTGAITLSDRVVISNDADDMLVRGQAGGGWSLCAESGRASTSSGPGCHKYLEHHQLGDQWRG